MPVAISIEWKPLRDPHYVVASLQPGGGGLRQVFARQSTLSEVQAFARGDPDQPVVGLLLGERLDCSLTLKPYVLIESHVEVAVASLDERTVSDAIRTLRGRVGQRNSVEVLGWFCSSQSVAAAVSRTHAAVHAASFAEPWQIILTFGDGGHAGAFFLYDTRSARWFHAPFYEVTDSNGSSRAPKPTSIAWPAYLTTSSVVPLAESPQPVSVPPGRQQSAAFARPVVKVRRTPARDAIVGVGRAAVAARRSALDFAKLLGGRATERIVGIRAKWAASAAQRKAEADAARVREEERRAREEARRAKEAAERRAAHEEAQRRAAEAEKQRAAEAEQRRAAEAEARRAAEAEARRKAAEEAERRRVIEAEAKRQAADTEARCRAEEAEARRVAEAEAQRKEAEEAHRKAAETEARRKAAEEAQRKAAAEEKRRAAEAEARRQAAEVESQRQAAEAEARRLAEAEAKAQRQAAEAEARRVAEAEAQHKAAAEAQRKAAETEARRKAAEEAQRKAAEEQQRRAAEAEAEARRRTAEAEARRAAEAEAEAQRQAAEAHAEAQQKAADAEEDARRKAAEAEAEARRRAAEAEALRISVEVAAIRQRFARDPVDGSKREASKVAAHWADLEDTAATDGPYRYLALAGREGFEVSERIERGTPENPETVWLLYEKESGLRLVVVTTDAAVREASLHYNLRTEDESVLRVTAPEHRDLESRTIYGREACLHDLRARCRRLRATGALERDWKVSPTFQQPASPQLR